MGKKERLPGKNQDNCLWCHWGMGGGGTGPSKISKNKKEEGRELYSRNRDYLKVKNPQGFF